MKKLSKYERLLLHRVNRHTHICDGCYGLWAMKKWGKSFRLVLNIKSLEETLKAPKDRRKFVRHKSGWWHKRCVIWHQNFRKSLIKEAFMVKNHHVR